MTNEEKAKELADIYMPDTGFNREDLYDAAMEMAKWKDEQFKKFLREICFVSEKFINEKFDKINEL